MTGKGLLHHIPEVGDQVMVRDMTCKAGEKMFLPPAMETYYSTEGLNYYYTSTFGGTSSASPIVAGALACIEGYYLANVSSTPPTPSYMRYTFGNLGNGSRLWTFRKHWTKTEY